MTPLLNETPEAREQRLERMFRGRDAWYRWRIAAGMQDLFSPGTLELLGLLALAATVAFLGYHR